MSRLNSRYSQPPHNDPADDLCFHPHGSRVRGRGSALVKAIEQVVSERGKIAVRRKPLPPRRRRKPPANIRDTGEYGNP
jgi:hypothetical protein